MRVSEEKAALDRRLAEANQEKQTLLRD
jgi:DNA repair exonuclease SbcCD ATPase subunit